MNVILLLRLPSAHILADFFLQNDKLCNAKSEAAHIASREINK